MPRNAITVLVKGSVMRHGSLGFMSTDGFAKPQVRKSGPST